MGNPVTEFGTNLQKMVTNVGDRFHRNAAPEAGNPINFPTQNDGSVILTRGMLVPQLALGDQKSVADNAILFQFNPEEITYDKGLHYASHQRLGYSYEIPFWVSGGSKTISFKLMLDGTAGSMFKNMSVYSPRSSYKNDNNVPNSSYVNLDDYRNSSDGNGKGLLDIIAKFEALTYPMRKGNKDTVRFNFGQAQVSELQQFNSPPYVLFTYGDISANCFVNPIGRKDILFNSKLNPIRTELEITLTVIEAKVLDKQFILKTNPNIRSIR